MLSLLCHKNGRNRYNQLFEVCVYTGVHESWELVYKFAIIDYLPRNQRTPVCDSRARGIKNSCVEISIQVQIFLSP